MDKKIKKSQKASFTFQEFNKTLVEWTSQRDNTILSNEKYKKAVRWLYQKLDFRQKGKLRIHQILGGFLVLSPGEIKEKLWRALGYLCELGKSAHLKFRGFELFCSGICSVLKKCKLAPEHLIPIPITQILLDLTVK